jgi:hypothetical protein
MAAASDCCPEAGLLETLLTDRSKRGGAYRAEQGPGFPLFRSRPFIANATLS